MTGSTVTIYANNAGNNSGSSVLFVNSGTTSTLNLTDINNNTFLGKNCGNISVSGTNNFGAGFGCLAALTSGGSNTGAGISCLAGLKTGSGNVAYGQQALASYTGDNTVGIGLQTLFNLTASGTGNTACGHASLTSLVSGSNNTAFGTASGSAVTGNNNTAVGFQALENSKGDSNTAVGHIAYSGIGTTGSYNLCLGYSAGLSLTTSDSSNIYLSNNGTPGDNHVMRLGTTGTGPNQVSSTFVAGVAGVTVASSAAVLINTSTGQLGTLVSSARFKENIRDLQVSSSPLNLRPVSFNMIGDELELHQVGLIAEEVDKVLPELVTYDVDGKPYTVKYHELCVHLLLEMQNMARRIEDLEKAA